MCESDAARGANVLVTHVLAKAMARSARDERTRYVETVAATKMLGRVTDWIPQSAAARQREVISINTPANFTQHSGSAPKHLRHSAMIVVSEREVERASELT